MPKRPIKGSCIICMCERKQKGVGGEKEAIMNHAISSITLE